MPKFLTFGFWISFDIWILTFGFPQFAFAQIAGLPEGPSLPEVAGRLINILTGILGIVAVIVFIVAGAMWMTSGGDEEKIKRAKQMIVGAIIGTILILSSYAIVRFFFKSFEESGLIGAPAGTGVSGGLPGIPANAFLIESVSPPESPPAGAVPRNVAVRIRFSSPLDPTTLTAEDIIVKVIGRTAEDDGRPLANLQLIDIPVVGSSRLVDERTVVWRPNQVCEAAVSEKCFPAWRRITVTVKEQSIAAPDSRVLHCGNGKCERNFTTNALVDLEPPRVRILEPSAGDTIPGGDRGAATPIRVEATDDSGVAQVNFFADARKLGSVTQIPYLWNWDTAALVVGSNHEVGALAIDLAEHEGRADPVRVNVGSAQCSNRLLDPGETGIDCGGDCPGLCSGAACRSPSDCRTGRCENGRCVGIPQGGSCLQSRQCDSGNCIGGTCAAPITRPRTNLPTGSACTRNEECSSGVCTEGRCAARASEEAGGAPGEGTSGTRTGPPTITAIDPRSAPQGQIITITGRNFGQPGRVLFEKPDKTLVPAEGLPQQCGTGFWTTTQILAKVPRSLESGSSNVIVERGPDSARSTPFVFPVGGTPRPNLCRLEPPNGLPGITEITLYGERFGNERGKVKFHENVEVTGEALSRWQETRAQTIVPVSAETGPVRLLDSGGTISNALQFSVGACEIGKPNSCSSGRECCGDGICQPVGSCTSVAPQCTYGWSFVTSSQRDPSEDATYCESVTDCLGKCLDLRLARDRFRCVNNHCAPIITDFSPDNGAPGTWVTINGCFFGETAGTVKFIGGYGAADDREGIAPDPRRCGPTWTNTQIIREVPRVDTPTRDDDAKTGWMRVITQNQAADGSALSTETATSFTVNGQIRPGICRLDPMSGKAGDSVNVIGQNFGDERPGGREGTRWLSNVYFENLPSEGAVVNRWGNESIEVKAPEGLEAAKRITSDGAVVDVEARLLEGRESRVNSNPKSFYLPPYITKLTPDRGPTATWVTISGGNFGLLPGGVTFNDRPADILPDWCTRTWTDTQIITKAPSAVEDGLVRVTTARELTTTDKDSKAFDLDTGLPLPPGLCTLETAYCTVQLTDPDADRAERAACAQNSSRGPIANPATAQGDNIATPQDRVQGELRYSPAQIAPTSMWKSTEISHFVPDGTQNGPVQAVQTLSRVIGRRCSGIRIGTNCLLGGWVDIVAAASVPSNPLAFTLVGESCTQPSQCASGKCEHGKCVAGFSVIEMAPSCQAACVNAAIFARLGKAIDPEIVSNNVIMGPCPNPACDPSAVSPIAGVMVSALEEVLPSELVLGRLLFSLPPTYNNGRLIQATSYRVILKGALRSTAGDRLANLNTDLDGNGTPDAYSWVFRTKDDPSLCQPAKVTLEPARVNLVSLEGPESAVTELALPAGSPDSCRALGQVLNPWSFDWQWSSSDSRVATVSTVAMCGNGLIDIGEDCDDSNTTSGDGCSDRCLNEGAACFQQGTRCTGFGTTGGTILPEGVVRCNNGILEIGEECEDLDRSGDPGPGCNEQCLHKGSDSGVASCGNGVIERGEECDLGRYVFGLGCDPNTCLRAGSRSYTEGGTCGNGVVDRNLATGAGEDCDDDDARRGVAPVSDDGCAANCLWVGSSPALGDRLASVCGNGRLEYAEECEASSTAGLPPWCMSVGQRRCTLAGSELGGVSCGNGVVERGEDCDDGNLAAGDGCSNRCLHEGSLKTTGQGPIQVATAVGAGDTTVSTGIVGGLMCNAGQQECSAVTVSVEATPISVLKRQPEGADQCSNQLIEITFSTLMDPASLSPTTIELHGPCERSPCPANAPSVGGTQVETQIKEGKTIVTLHHPDLLRDKTYQVVVKRNETRGTLQPGVRAQSGGTLPQDVVWHFTTNAPVESCLIDRVEVLIDPLPPGIAADTPTNRDFFTCAGKNDCLNDQSATLEGNQHNWRARVVTVGNTGADVSVTFHEAEPSGGVVSVVQNGTSPTAWVISEAGATAKKGEEIVTVTANGGVYGTKFTDVVATTFLCENPWPSLTEFPWRLEDPLHLTLYYCRDAGAQGPADDLHELEVVPVTRSRDVNPGLLKEYLLKLQAREGEPVSTTRDLSSIGLRLYENPYHYTAADWYTLQPFPKGSGTQATTIDGYRGIVDGRSTYVHVADRDREDVLRSRIALLSVSQDAGPEMQGIFNQLKGTLTFNTNREVSIVGESKKMLQRDTVRISDLQRAAGWLGDYKSDLRNRHCSISTATACRPNPIEPACTTDECETDMCPSGEKCVATYPLLESGTFVPGLSTSKWPSWTAALGNALRKSLPVDPTNTFGNCLDADPASCWNERDLTYQCPAASHIYQYRIISEGFYYELASDFEYRIPNGSNTRVPDWSPRPDSHLVFSDSCGTNVTYAATGFCGDGRINFGEACDSGRSNREGWGQAPACLTSCLALAPYCGDAHVDVEHERCDLGAANSNAYGSLCRTDCQGLAPRCGDDQRNGPEECDGADLGSTKYREDGGWQCLGSGALRCASSCLFSCSASGTVAQCGSGTFALSGRVQNVARASLAKANVEVRDTRGRRRAQTQTGRDGRYSLPVVSRDTGASPCGLVLVASKDGYGTVQTSVLQITAATFSQIFILPRCGDGVVTSPEVCDDGARNSDAWSATRHCNVNCTAFGPYCGDGTRQKDFEACDSGVRLDPHCSASCRLR